MNVYEVTYDTPNEKYGKSVHTRANSFNEAETKVLAAYPSATRVTYMSLESEFLD